MSIYVFLGLISLCVSIMVLLLFAGASYMDRKEYHAIRKKIREGRIS